MIPARDAAAALPATLAPLAGVDVVVVDNASRDETAAVARQHGARVVVEPRPGRALARNAGARATDADLLVFLDAGCVPRAGWLDALERCDGDLRAGAVVVETSSRPTAAERFEAAWRFQQERNVANGWSVSANLAVRREVFERIGGFDPAYRHVGEDVDLCLRATATGARLVLCPEGVVTHPAERRVAGVVKRAFWQGFASVQHARRLPGRAGHRYWRHPRPLVAGDWPLRALGIEDRALLPLARLDYAGRVAGSAWAELRLAR